MTDALQVAADELYEWATAVEGPGELERGAKAVVAAYLKARMDDEWSGARTAAEILLAELEGGTP